MFNLQNVITAYAALVTAFFLWSFFRTQVSLRGRVDALEQDMSRSFENIYRHIDDTVQQQQNDLKEARAEINADIDSVYRSLDRVENDKCVYSGKQK